MDSTAIVRGRQCDRPGCPCHRSAAKGYGLTHCPVHPDQDPSLSVFWRGGELAWDCKAGCDWREVTAALRKQGLIEEDGRRSLWRSNGSNLPARRSSDAGSLDSLAVRGSTPSRPPRKPQPSPEQTNGDDELELCARILNEAHADPGRIAAYLRHRGLSGEVPPTLRLHPGLTCEGRRWPTMVAPFVDPRGKLVGIHRTFLATDGPGKAPVKSPKKFLGQVTGAAIHLDEPRAGVLATSEGIENGLAAREVLGLPVWVAGSAAGLAAMELPDELRQLWTFADNDKAGYERGAVPLAERAAASGIEVYLLRSRLKDWLDELLVHGPEVLREAKEAARPWKPAVVFRSYGREVERLLSHLAEGEPCQKIREHRAELFVACKAGTDTKRLLTALYRLLREGARGHPGAREVLEDAWLRFSERSKDEDALVWQRWKRLVTDAAQGISDVLAREEKGDCRCGAESDFWGS